MGIILIIILILILILLISLYRGGIFGIYTEIDSNRKAMYCWYKGHIISSTYFNFNDSKEIINKKKKQCIQKAKQHVKKLKEFKNRLND